MNMRVLSLFNSVTA